MCDANDINGCEQTGTIQLKTRHGRLEGMCCSEECANELAAELSEGTWVPFPNASNAISRAQQAHYLREYDARYRD
jgi:hypothetical protein